MVLRYHKTFKHLILGRHTRYLDSEVIIQIGYVRSLISAEFLFSNSFKLINLFNEHFINSEHIESRHLGKLSIGT